MVPTIVLALSIAFQLLAAFLALRLIQFTGRHLAWILISSALILMAVRRVVTLAGLLSDGYVRGPDLHADLVALGTSVLMAMGIYLIGPVLAAIQQSKRTLASLSLELEEKVSERTRELRKTEGALIESHRKLEKRVEERTADLREANTRLQKEIMERRRAEDELAAEKEHLAVTLASIGDGVITTDTAGQVVLMNKKAEELTGWTQRQAAGKELGAVFNIVDERTREQCENPVERVLATGTIVGLSNHTALIAKDSTERIIADSGSPIRGRDGRVMGVVLVFRDITEKRTREEEIRRVEKLEAIGLLAGGIAHDFNNILTAIVGNLRLATMYGNSDDKIVSLLTAAERASLRAKDLTRQLLTFSRGGTPVKKIAQISDVVKECADFALRGSNVRCDFHLPDDLWPVEIDEGQIGQVVENLVINADQAMPDGGIITISARNVTVEPEHNVAIPLEAGTYVRFSVSDSGHGITKENLAKIFDPYFTTKPKGSGLGLTSSYSIIKNHEGSIAIESELDVGTTFHVYLPASPEGAVGSREMQAMPTSGRGKVLLVDDEEVIREVTREILMLLGYEAVCAIDGVQAIEMYREALESGRPFDAVIMDLTIPGGMGGKAAMRKLLKIDPGVKAIVSSGYSNDQVMSDYERYGFKGIVPKPYDVNQLSKILHEVIHDGQGKDSQSSQ